LRKEIPMKRYKKRRQARLILNHRYHILRTGSDTRSLCGVTIIGGNIRESHPGRSRLCNRCRTISQSRGSISG